ncbi:hypothetical protein COV18_04995 [Candidatus Woesearchaeota archaeon CG10_big_fil_rev_8_21_14_0_10_37_12]|nr:MAG: hypothetical protein COV18_04995 [Candidatus Woesearchaeota archaeon CG10_big_fil_rev_8_21_14_0_10_37_12]
MIKIIHRGHDRQGRGFTPEEVLEAGLTCQQFGRITGVRWEPRRKTKYSENVKFLKELASKLPEETKKESKPKKVIDKKPAVKKAEAKKK